MNVRAAAVRVMLDIVEKRHSLNDALANLNIKWQDSRDAALLQAICYGVCRWYFHLQQIAQQLLKTPLKPKDQDINLLILIGLYQLLEMRIPRYAAVNETVNATTFFKKNWAKNVVNGVLREYLRRADTLSPSKSYSHPEWMVEKLQQDYPANWQDILDANNQHPPFALRVNQMLISRENYLAKLALADIEAKIIPVTDSGIILQQASDVQGLPGFAAGEIFVQDGAAQLAAELLQLKPNHRVLDACAAPGGKTTHMLEMQPTIECVAVDRDSMRLTAVSENLTRLHLSALCIHADAAETGAWWDKKLFDRILLDAPCSASGVIRRHPDSKLLRRMCDIPLLVAAQLTLLNALWPLLKPGGLLLYVTCSIFREENQGVVQSFLANCPEAQEELIHLPWALDCPVGKQILPGMQSMDGFYFACLRK